jgi:hypothetical protein
MFIIKPGYDNPPEPDPAHRKVAWFVIVVIVTALVLMECFSPRACIGSAIVTDTATTVVMAEGECV